MQTPHDEAESPGAAAVAAIAAGIDRCATVDDTLGACPYNRSKNRS
jgi:hypothetical protein